MNGPTNIARLLFQPGHAPAALALLAFSLYLPGFWWGVPYATAPDRVHSWGVDAPMPLGPLAEIYNILRPQPDRNLGYPLMHSFVVSAAYTPYLGYLWLTGQLGAVRPTYPYGLADPVGVLKRLALIAHSLSVLMGVGIVLAAYDAARALWGRPTAVVAAVLVMLLFPIFYYARTGNVDVPMLFFLGLALAAFSRSLARGLTQRRAIWMGVFAGFALATKEQAFASLLAVPLVLIPLHWLEQEARVGWFSWAFWQTPLVAVLAAFLTFGVGSGLFVDPERYFAHVEFARQRMHALVGGQLIFLHSFPRTLEGHLQLAQLIVRYLSATMTLPGLLLAFVGLVWILQRELKASAFLLPAFTYLFVLFWSARAVQIRYVLPAAFTLAFAGARAVVLAWESKKSYLRAAFGLWVFVIVALGFLRGVDLTYAMIHDSRYSAAAWLDSRTGPGDRVETFGPVVLLPPLKSGVVATQAIPFFGGARPPRLDESTVQETEEGWIQRRPKFIIILPDYTSPPGVPYSASCPPKIYEDLVSGVLGYRLVAFFQTPALFPWVRRPSLDYPTVNPPIRIFARQSDPVY